MLSLWGSRLLVERPRIDTSFPIIPSNSSSSSKLRRLRVNLIRRQTAARADQAFNALVAFRPSWDRAAAWLTECYEVPLSKSRACCRYPDDAI